MKTPIMFTLVAPLAVFALVAQDETPEVEAARGAVETSIRSYTEAIQAEDVKSLMNLFAQDDDLVTVNVHLPGIVRGPDAVASAARQWFSAVEAPKLVVRDRTIRISPTGEAAWAAFVLDQSHSIPGSSERYTFTGTRVTWGLEKRNGNYVIVQAHWSFVSKG
jgi:ketosteroid isomerase-like protein